MKSRKHTAKQEISEYEDRAKVSKMKQKGLSRKRTEHY